jgi:hypothetical protein
MNYRFGFTGTRHGMTETQKRSLRDYISGFKGIFHHGDCIGSDSEAHDIADESGYGIIIHPPSDPTHRAWREVPRHMMREEKSHFARNRDIVDDATSLIATPFESTEQPKGGTWYTVRYARKRGKPVVLILPDGSIHQS